MEKSMIKKYIVNISLIVILFASGFFAVYSIVNITSVLFNTSTSLFNVLLQFFSIANIALTIFLVKVLYDNSFKKNQTL